MFVDEATITVVAGKGGDGIVSFRKEKFVPMGGPAGGNGGRGGDVYLVADSNIRDLITLLDQPAFSAQDGANGGSNNKTGASGKDIILKVPVGVTIYLEGDESFVADLVTHGQELLVAKGGRGGLGNARFVNSKRQAPHIATAGQTGESLRLRIELKVLGDVGLVGMPNAGKSTLLTSVSRATPKIADYPFTTLEPNLGVVTMPTWERFTIADIPGLIEGASHGKGLGYEFLRHVQRCRVLLYLVDLSVGDSLETLKMLWNEIKLYSEETFAKPAFIVGNKIDLLPEDFDDPLEKFAQSRNISYMRISGKDHIHVEELLEKLHQKVKETPAPETRVAEEIRLIAPQVYESSIEVTGTVFVVKNERLERIITKTDIETIDGLGFVQRQIERLGIEKKLKHAGIKSGDTVSIAGKRFTYE
jgi:GTP-binding protein